MSYTEIDEEASGLTLGQSASSKVGFYGATPVVQPSGASQAALGNVTTVGNNTGNASATLGLTLIGNTTSADQSTAIMNDLAALRDDMANAFTLITAIRSALVAQGIIKGAA